MGYDMFIVGDLPEGTGRDAGYFRLNIWGMGRWREEMAAQGMLAFDGQDSFKSWPQPEQYGLDQKDVAAMWERYDENEDSEVLSERELAWMKAVEEFREGDTGGPIPERKLGSNDGWLVTPEEIAASLKVAQEDPQVLGPDDVDYWREWLAWLRVAELHGGFRVF